MESLELLIILAICVLILTFIAIKINYIAYLPKNIIEHNSKILNKEMYKLSKLPKSTYNKDKNTSSSH